MASTPSLQPDANPRTSFTRRRTAYACHSCRSRKTRCNGQSPCSTCSALAINCTYGTELAPSKGKSDLILNAILRVESSVQQIEDRITALQQSPGSYQLPRDTDIGSPVAATPSAASLPQSRGKSTSSNLVDNAIISTSHNSTTESILAWPVFDEVTPLREDGCESIFQLENTRLGIRFKTHSHPYLSRSDAETILGAFQRSINFFYPIISYSDQQSVITKVIHGQFEDSLESCLALNVIALGCAAETVTQDPNVTNQSDSDHQQRFSALGQAFFHAALRMNYLASPIVSSAAAQCLLLTAWVPEFCSDITNTNHHSLYYAFLQRPLQAWSMLSVVASKCQVLLAYGNLTSEDNECVRRMFWSCFILESDYLAELSILPHFGVAEMESSVPLPGRFHSHEDDHAQSQSSLYFLACISMRRLLNRAHHLLFDSEVGANLHDVRFTRLVAELDQQLTRWKELLPPEFYFSVDQNPVPSQHAAFLRQRYLTCKALIYRPYLLKALSNSATVADHTIQSGCKVCLQACLLHCLNLNHFTHTILIDVWICALSMSGTMLLFLAVKQIPGLKDCLDRDIQHVGSHLQNLLHSWISNTGSDQSPSVSRAIDWITTVDELLR